MPSSTPILPPAGAHGGDGPAVEAALGLPPGSLLDLSQNMNPLAPPVTPVVARHLDAVGHYPDDRDATRLLAEALGVDPARVLLTNGGSEAIHLVTQVLGGAVRSEPEFGLHPRGADDRPPGATGDTVGPEGKGPVWRTDPHSPTGRLAGPDEDAGVWDEAFYALATGSWSAREVRPDRDEAVVVGSLTKTFACPGLRLGYVVGPEGEVATLAPEELMARLRTAQPHWSVSALSLAVLPDLLESADLPAWAAGIATLRGELVGVLETAGLRVEAGDAPWVLVRESDGSGPDGSGPDGSGAGLRELLAPRGVLVRDCTSFGMPGVVRMAVPGPEGVARVAGALADGLADGL